MAPLYIDATGGITMAKLAARAPDRLKRMVGLDLLIVDYLQLITGGDGIAATTTGCRKSR